MTSGAIGRGRTAQLDRWRADLDSLYGGGDPGVAAMLVPHVRRFGLRREDFEAVIDGMAMDVAADIRWPSADILDLYCDRVASAVGRLSVRVFGMAEAPGLELSHHLGRALQLTNILRDIDEDAAIGRVYLPLEAIEAQGIVVGDIAGGAGRSAYRWRCTRLSRFRRRSISRARKISCAAAPRGT